MTIYATRREVARPSLRDLAAAAEVSVPTLRHYFGVRREVIDALLEESLRLGRAGLDAQSKSDAPFPESIRQYSRALIGALSAQRDVKLGDLFAMSLGEGLLDVGVSQSTLRHTLEPTIETLEARLAHHVARGEMIDTDIRTAALMLLSPLLLASLHQNQLQGAGCRPMALETTADDLSAAFVRAYARQPATADAPKNKLVVPAI
jgi:AcrR family transcriptional regulator